MNFFLWRPIISDPPIYTLGELKTLITLEDVLDAHEALDLRAAAAEKANSKG